MSHQLAECAVEGCEEQGRAWVCPADNARHGHGRIHYEDCHSDLTFRPDWGFVCGTHYHQLVAARKAWEANRVVARLLEQKAAQA
jgi:hypothetical protein